MGKSRRRPSVPMFLSIIYLLLLCCYPLLGENVPSRAEPAKTVDEFVKAFSDAEHFWQQFDIALELVALGDTTIIPRIEKYLDTQDRRRRCNAALVLAGLGDKRGIPIIIGELRDKNPRPTEVVRSDDRQGSARQIEGFPGRNRR